ncbi:hypothetical protein [Ferrovibrio sp.]|uniref:hypothetical protein n=1 Tax=Ferrovibrio sp. TaxID=1917215 RepID=UPI003D0ACE49
MSDRESEKEVSETKNQIEKILTGKTEHFDWKWVPREDRARRGSKEYKKRALMMALDFLNRAHKNKQLLSALKKKIRDEGKDVRGNAVPHVAFIRVLFPAQSGPTEHRLGCALKFAQDKGFTPKQFYADMEARGGYTGYAHALKGTAESEVKSAKTTKAATNHKQALQRSGVKKTSDGSGLKVSRGNWLVALGRRKKSTGQIEYYSFRSISDASLLKLVKLFPELKAG